MNSRFHVMQNTKKNCPTSTRHLNIHVSEKSVYNYLIIYSNSVLLINTKNLLTGNNTHWIIQNFNYHVTQRKIVFFV